MIETSLPRESPKEITIKRQRFDTGSNIVTDFIEINLKDELPDIEKRALSLYDELAARQLPHSMTIPKRIS